MSDDLEDDVKAISMLLTVLRPLDADTRAQVLEFVIKRLGISLTMQPGAAAHKPGISDLNLTHSTQIPAVQPSADIRSFAAEKAPRTVNQKVAVIGYYFAHLASASERREFLTAQDIEPYFVQAGFPLPSAPASITLANAKNAGYLNAVGRGQFKLNAIGYNLVAHKLPSGEAGGKQRTAVRKRVKNIEPSKPKR
jgi:hypothetical protein